MTDKFRLTIEQIDAINQQDPNKEIYNGSEIPKELLYAQRMTEVLKDYEPNAGELLQIAARGQHIKRWSIPRTDYPEGKAGYHQWRRKLADIHVKLIGEIMLQTGYSNDDVDIIDSLIHKKELESNNDSQILQDVVSIVFLKYYAEDFIKKHASEKVGDILAKMLRKVSQKGIEEAIKKSPEEIASAIKNMKV